MLVNALLIIAFGSLLFYGIFRISKYGFVINFLLIISSFVDLMSQNPDFEAILRTVLFIGCPLILSNTAMYVFFQKEDESSLAGAKYEVNFKIKTGKFKIKNIKRGASVIGAAGSGKTESVVYGFLEHFRKYSFCGVIHDYKDFEITEMAYPLFKESDIKFYIISFDKIIHRVNPIAPRYLENEESVNEVSRVLIENLLEQKESGTTGSSRFFNDAAEGLIGGLIWKLKTSYPQYCTLPHLIAVYQYLDTDSPITFLKSNTTSRAMADAFISGKDSERQTAGVKSTLANALKKISTQ
ncbi:MAG: type IV secretory system conjugative DNA transfer family protein, partial [Flavobacteriaceae bacterium]|nr:type IV secretory system conjugative DNA transfer family protein [Flavobacteriaceae bacterium]